MTLEMEDGNVKAPWWIVTLAALVLGGGSSLGTLQFYPDPALVVTTQDLENYVKKEDLLREFKEEIRPINQGLANINAKLEVVLSHSTNHERRISKLEAR